MAKIFITVVSGAQLDALLDGAWSEGLRNLPHEPPGSLWAFLFESALFLHACFWGDLFRREGVVTSFTLCFFARAVKALC